MSQEITDAVGCGFFTAPAAAVVLGTLVGLADDGQAYVSLHEQATVEALVARSIMDLRVDHIGCQVALVFIEADPAKPLVIGVLRDQKTAASEHETFQVALDGKRLVLTAAEEITLKCGHASIVLTKAGKVLIQGAYVSSRSTGVNRIRGGSVEIN